MLVAPFDLTTFPFTRGDDVVDVTSDATPPPIGRFPAIFNDGVVRMLSGNNSVTGAITGLGSSSIQEFIGLSNSGLLLGGRDVDEIKGSVTPTGPIEDRFFNPFFIGISGEPSIVSSEDGDIGAIMLAAGEDTVNGTVDIPAIQGAQGVSGVGIRAIYIDTARDDDTVVGQATVAGAVDGTGEVAAFGIADTILFTGTGKDFVNGAGIAQSGTQVFAGGIINSEIDTVMEFGGFLPLLISLFDRGKDDILGTGEATGVIANAFGILNTDIRTGFGADAVDGEATATGETEAGFALAVGINGEGDSVISTGGGADNVVGDATAHTEEGGNSVAIGIALVEIFTGGGTDTVFATATATAGNDSAALTGIGIQDARIHLGGGSDLLQARGTTSGIRDVELIGGRGADFFDVQSGTGFINGGSGIDNLTLAGNLDEFEFEVINRQTIRVIDLATAGEETDIVTKRVDVFSFDDADLTRFQILSDDVGVIV